MSIGIHRNQKVSDTLELDLQLVMNYSTRILGTELESSTIAAYAFFLFFKGGVGFHYQKSRNEEPQSWLCAFHVKNWGLAQIGFSRHQ